MMRNFLFFVVIAALFLISCSDGDKFDASGKRKLELRGIICEQYGSNIYTSANVLPIDKEGYYYYCYWTIDGERVSSNNYPDDNCLEMKKEASYGEHFLKFILIDSFEDTLSDTCSIRIPEPLKITLLSPVDGYKAEKTDTIKFQYKISGIDTWEENPQTKVYISTDKEVWEPIDSLLTPPFTKDVYYWKVKAFTEQDTTEREEFRSIWIKK